MSAVLSPDMIVPSGTATTKAEAIREAGALLVGSGAVGPAYVDAMFDRELEISTYMGNYLAIPHGTNVAKGEIRRSALCLLRYDGVIDWDGNPVRAVVGIAGVGDEHLAMLSRIALVFSDTERVDRLLAAATAAELFDLLQEVEPA